jgi:hypothetical protein
MNSDATRQPDDDDPVPLSGFDPAQLERLLALAGPADRAALLHRLTLDLEHLRDRLARLALPADWLVLRAQTHVLVAIAGAVGAERLRILTDALNDMAHQGHRAAALRLLPQVLDGIDHLLGFVRRVDEGRGE